MFDGAIRNLQSSISLLQLYILNRQKAGFKDMERMLEALCSQTFKAVEIGNFVNMNQIKVNFPAIDLADDEKSIAIQVTSNASPAKIKKTILVAANCPLTVLSAAAKRLRLSNR